MSYGRQRPYVYAAPMDERELSLQGASILTNVLKTLREMALTLEDKKNEIVDRFGDKQRTFDSEAEDIKRIMDATALSINITDENHPLIRAGRDFIESLLDPGEDYLDDLNKRKRLLQNMNFAYSEMQSTINHLSIRAASTAIYMISSLLKGGKKRERSELREEAQRVFKQFEVEDL